MKTVFIILNYKTYNDTITLTDELLNQRLGDRKILIVDNDSPNKSYDILKYNYEKKENVEVVSSGLNGGYAKGNNYGLRYVKRYNPKYVCIINNDVHFSLEMIKRLEDRYASIDKVAFISPIQYLPSNKVAPFVNLKTIPSFWDDVKSISGLFKHRIHRFEADEQGGDLQKVEIVPGAFLFVDYSLFEKLGFFYEGTFLFCEERFTAKRVKEFNLYNYVLLNEKYLHMHSTTINSEASQRRQQKMLFEGKVLYTICYREYPLIKVGLLNIFYYTFLPFRIILSKVMNLLIK